MRHYIAIASLITSAALAGCMTAPPDLEDEAETTDIGTSELPNAELGSNNTGEGGLTAAARAGALLLNTGFEDGATSWLQHGSVITASPRQPANSGSWKAWLLGNGVAKTETFSQAVAIPDNVTVVWLVFFLHIDTDETTTTKAFDVVKLQARDSKGALLATLATYSNLDKQAGYVFKYVDLTRFQGKSINLYFTGTEDSSLQTSFVFDDFFLETLDHLDL